jgi:hypothetical protein
VSKSTAVKKSEPPAPPAAAEAVDVSDVAAVWAQMGRLHPWEGNPRKNASVVRHVANSIIRFGWGAVILARAENGEMVAGHTRFAAAELLRVLYARATVKQREEWHPDAVRTATEGVVPVRFGNWSEREAHLLAIADNRLNELAEWDSEALARELNRYSLGEAATIGYEAKELASMFAKLGTSSDTADTSSTNARLGATLKYSLMVTCADETQQAELLERLEAEGFPCKPIIT